MTQTLSIDSAKVAWLVKPRFLCGYGTDLAYFGPILESYARRIRNLTIYWDEDIPIPAGTELPLVPILKIAHIGIGKSPHTYQRKRTFEVPHPKIIAQVVRDDPDVLVLNEFNLVTVCGLVASRIGRRRRVMLLVENHPAAYETAPLDLRRRMRKTICRFCDLYLTNGRSGAKYLAETLGVPGEMIVTGVFMTSELPNGESVRQARVHVTQDGRRVTFLYVGQLIERKGLHYLLRAIAELDPEYKQRLHLEVIGDGEMREALESLAKALHIEKHVAFKGSVSYASLAEHYRSADVFVLPTLFDFRALASFEALGQGLPVLMSIYNGAAEEVVLPSENGFLFDPKDVPQFTLRLAWFLDHPGELPKFGRRSRELSQNFTVETAVSNLVAATVQSLAGRRSQTT